mgnify:CR=1 FL=1
MLKARNPKMYSNKLICCVDRVKKHSDATDLIKSIRKQARALARLRHCPQESLDGLRLVYEDESRRRHDVGTSVFLIDAETGAGLMTYVSHFGHNGHEDMYGRIVRSATVVKTIDLNYIRSLDPITCSPSFRYGANREVVLPVFEWSKIAQSQNLWDKLLSRHRWSRSHYSLIGDRNRLYECSREDCIQRLDLSDIGAVCQNAVDATSSLFLRLHQ